MMRGFRVLLGPAKIEGTVTGTMKAIQVSQQLASFLGVSHSSRPQVVKQIWAHIKLHNLQNPNNKSEIRCDTKLRMLFQGRDSINSMEIFKLLSPHFAKKTT